MSKQGPIDFDPVPDDAPEQQAASERQRLRIHVPHLKTTLTMGGMADKSKIRSEDAGDMNFPGFGVTTEGHVFIDAKGSPMDSMMRLQSTGPLTVQTPMTLALGGQTAAVLASADQTMCAGAGGVAILGGNPMPWSSNQVNDSKSPDHPQWISNLSSSLEDFKTFWNLIDCSLGVHQYYKQMTSKRIAGYDIHTKTSAMLAAHAGLAGALGSLADAMGGLTGTESLNPLDGTTIHGTGGLIMGTGMTAGLYSAGGTTIYSPASISVNSAFTEVWGSKQLVLSSKMHASIQSEAMASVIAKSNVLVASREGTVTMAGKSLFIGRFVSLGDAKQVETETIGVESTKQVSLTSDDVMLTGKKAVTVGAPEVQIAAQKALRLAGGKGLVRLESDEAVIGLASAAPNLDLIKKYRDEVAEIQTKHEDAMRMVEAQRQNDYERSGSYITSTALRQAENHAEALARSLDDLKSKISELEHKKNAITFKPDGIELTFEGTKMKLDASGVSSGPLKWKAS